MTGKTKKTLKKLAYGDGKDALRLLFGFVTEQTVEDVDITDVAQIKISEKGGGEIRFVDRIAALKMLEEEREKTAAGKDNGFIEALKASVS
ncbi:MAG: hypothetical protein K6B52_09530 [Clostridiales bacterium]|nr:hypothetical protein [Clostridiales bacterium]